MQRDSRRKGLDQLEPKYILRIGLEYVPHLITINREFRDHLATAKYNKFGLGFIEKEAVVKILVMHESHTDLGTSLLLQRHIVGEEKEEIVFHH